MRHDAVKLYQIGEIDTAWSVMNYLLELGRGADQFHDFRHLAVERCKRNLDTLVTSLVDRNYIFCENDSARGVRGLGDVWKKPDDDSIKASQALSEQFGNAGYLVHAWMEEIGDFNINGYFESWGDLIESDPLWIEFQSSNYVDYFESEVRENDEPWILADYQLIFAPDSLHKADISGSSGPAINIPAGIPEGSVRVGLRQISFRNYLNSYFSAGGFLSLPSMRSERLAECDFIEMLASRMLKI